MPESAPDPRLYASRLRALARGIPQASEERSFCLLPGRVESRRFVLGIPPAGWAFLPLASLREHLDMPGTLQQEFLAQLDRADMLGLGFEQDESACTLTALLEFPLSPGLGHGTEDGDAASILMGRGYRWQPGGLGDMAESGYQWWPELDARAIARRIKALLGTATALQAGALSIISEALQCSNPLDWAYVEVTRDNGAPTAFDLDISAAELSLDLIRPRLETLVARFGIPPADLAAVLDTTGAQALHRIAAGLDERERPFLTVHYES